MKKIIKIFFLIGFYIGSPLYAESGNQSIEIVGEIKKEIQSNITVKKLYKLVKTNEFEVYNPWEKKTDVYEGILIDDFIDLFAKKNSYGIRFLAIDGYEVEFKKSDWENERILLSLKVNGEFIAIRDRGPMRLVFVDYDKNKQKYKVTLKSWMWMITKIEVY